MSAAAGETTTGNPGQAPPTKPAPAQGHGGHSKSDGTSEEAKLTSHAILAAGDPGPAGLDLLHRDLFDSRSTVAVSALRALAAIADVKSLRYVVRFLGSPDKHVRLEAIRTAGEIKSSTAAKLLFELYKTARDDEIRCEALTALSKVAPSNQVLIRVIREQALSPLASTELRGCCLILLITLGGAEKVAEVLTAATRGAVEHILGWAVAHPEFFEPVIGWGLAHFGDLSASNRKLLVDIAARGASLPALELILLGTEDSDSEVRSASYRAIGKATIDSAHLAACVEHLVGKTETSYSLEEEVLAAIDRLERVAAQSGGLGSSTLSRLRRQSMELFNGLSAVENRVGSETVELGWLILKSREYLEYYADEEFRGALVHYLKGGIYHSGDQLLAMLKKTAERVEVRHFEGYRALGDIIKNPKRPGTSLIIRELNMAKLGKREPFGKLIRNLRLMRLASGAGKDTFGFVLQVFTWARSQQLFRLAEAALFVLAKFQPETTSGICRELLTPPIQSKILAIASMRLMKSLDASVLQPQIETLLRSTSDSHILLNMVDALQSVDVPSSTGILEAMITLMRTGQDIEVAGQAALFLATRSVPNLLSSVMDGFDHLDPRRQRIVLDLVNRKLEEARAKNVEGMSEFLYRILRNQASRLHGLAAVLLWKIGDDFAPKVISRLLEGGNNTIRIEIVHELEGFVDKTVAAEILKLLDEPHAGLHEAMRKTLLAVEDGPTADYIRRLVIRHRGGDAESSESRESPAESGSELERLEAGILTERQAFRFEHEFTRDLAVLFTDIQGYSSKAQHLTTMQVNSLIRDYEGILLPMMTDHHGTLVKRMGDGHLFVFDSPLDAGLASLRLQKALKRFNSYREELMRVVVRIGIHYGQVVQRDGDVLGNNVNIASRLESSAKGGSVLVSKALYDRFEGRILARELGKITVKGISEPIPVFEPYEIQIDLPATLDPLKNKATTAQTAQSQSPPERSDPAAATAGAGAGGNSDGGGASSPPEQEVTALEVGAGTVEYLSGVFSRLDEMCRRAERNEIEISAVRQELAETWDRFRDLVVDSLQKTETES